jgi:hypothetical protein
MCTNLGFVKCRENAATQSGILHRFSGDVIGLRAHARLTKTRAGYPRRVRRQLCRVRSDAQENACILATENRFYVFSAL